MSVKIMGQVWDLPLPASHKLLLLALADHCDHEGNNAHPGIALLAKKTGFSERSVSRLMSELRDQGLIVPTQNLEGGRGRATTYSVVMASQKPCQSDRVLDPQKPCQSDRLSEERVTNATGFPKERVTNATLKGDKSCSAYKEEPSMNRHEETKNTDHGEPTPAASTRPRNFAGELFDIFRQGYEVRHDGAAYLKREHDFPNLQRMLKGQKPGFLTIERWVVACENFFSSDLSSFTLADLAARFGTFYVSPTDRFGKMVKGPVSVNGAPTTRETDYERRLREDRERSARRAREIAALEEALRGSGVSEIGQRIAASDGGGFGIAGRALAAGSQENPD